MEHCFSVFLTFRERFNTKLSRSRELVLVVGKQVLTVSVKNVSHSGSGKSK